MAIIGVGYLYLVEDFTQGVGKIGFGGDADRRRIQMQTGNVSPLALTGALPTTYPVERELHAALAGYRVAGEWFRDLLVLRSVFRHLHDIVSELEFDGETPLLTVAHTAKIPGVIADHIAYVEQYGPDEDDPLELGRHLECQNGDEWVLPVWDAKARTWLSPYVDA